MESEVAEIKRIENGKPSFLVVNYLTRVPQSCAGKAGYGREKERERHGFAGV